MIEGHRVVALVPARGGSKGIPGKNLRTVAGRSLLAWTVDLALAMPELDRCLVSTDDDEIATEARAHGAEIHRRAPHLAGDDALVIDTVRAVVDMLSDEERDGILVLLEPTSPLRHARDVQGCLDGLIAGADSSLTLATAAVHPKRTFQLEGSHLRPWLDGVDPWAPRQALTPPAYQSTGAVYAFWTRHLPPTERGIVFGRVHPVLMPRDRAIDIDDPVDLELVEALLRRGVLDESDPEAGSG